MHKNAHSESFTWLKGVLLRHLKCQNLKQAWRDFGSHSFKTYSGFRMALQRWDPSKPNATSSSSANVISTLAGLKTPEELLQAFRAFQISKNIYENRPIDEKQIGILAGLYEDEENYHEAILLFERLYLQLKPEPTLAKAELSRRIGTCYRHLGKWTKSEDWYNKAQKELKGVNNIDQEPQSIRADTVSINLQFNTAMITWFKHGNSREWHDTLDHLINNTQSIIVKSECTKNPDSDLDHRLLHLKRQKAEALRKLGKYQAAIDLAQSLFTTYQEYFMGHPAAWSKAIELDSRRFLNSPSESLLSEFKTLEILATKNRWLRLAARCRLGIADIQVSLLKKDVLPVSGDSITNHMSSLLIQGRSKLTSNQFNEAKKLFNQAKQLIGDHAESMHFEELLSDFGIAESLRLSSPSSISKKTKMAAEGFRRLRMSFLECGSTWGALRCNAGLRLLNQPDWNLQFNFCPEGIDKSIEDKFLQSKLDLNKNVTLFDAVI